MNKNELLEKLIALQVLEKSDTCQAHINADKLLLEFIGDERIATAFWKVAKWHA